MWRRHPDETLARRLRDACALRDPEAIALTLHRAVEMMVDGGARSGSTAQVRGSAAAAEAIARRLGPATEVEVAGINGSFGLTLAVEGRVLGVLTFAGRRRLIERVWLVMDPAKLGTFNRA